MLPFLIPQQQAAQNLRDWVQSLWWAPNEFLRQGANGKFNGVYLPFWTFDAASTTQYDGKRGIVTADLKSEDFLGKNWFTKVLGRHVFTGLAAEDRRDYQSVNWAQNATTPDLITMYGLSSSSMNSIAGIRQFDWIYYLGKDLRSASSATESA